MLLVPAFSFSSFSKSVKMSSNCPIGSESEYDSDEDNIMQTIQYRFNLEEEGLNIDDLEHMTIEQHN